MGIILNDTETGDLPLGAKARQEQAKKVKLDLIGNIRRDIPNDSSMGFKSIMKGHLIAEFPNSTEN